MQEPDPEEMLRSYGDTRAFETLIGCSDEDRMEMHILQETISLKQSTHICRVDEEEMKRQLVCLLYSIAFEHPSLSQINERIQRECLTNCNYCLLRYIHARTDLIQALTQSFDVESVEDFLDILKEQELRRLRHSIQSKSKTKHLDLLFLAPSWLLTNEDSKESQTDDRAVVLAYVNQAESTFQDDVDSVPEVLTPDTKRLLALSIFCQLMSPATRSFAKWQLETSLKSIWNDDPAHSWKDRIIGVLAAWLAQDFTEQAYKNIVISTTKMFKYGVLSIGSPLSAHLVKNMLHIVHQCVNISSLSDVLIISTFCRVTACDDKFWKHEVNRSTT